MRIDPDNVTRIEIVVDGHSAQDPLVIHFDMVTRNEHFMDILTEDLEPLDDDQGDVLTAKDIPFTPDA